MATIVQHTETGEQYVLLGSGFGMFQSKKPNWLLGNLVADVNGAECALVCVCDASGLIGWLDSEEVNVISVDGKPVSELLP
jgi:hypothetical protein